MVSGKRNWSVNLWLPSCIKSTTAQNLIISNYARGMKKLQIRKVFLAFILLTSSYCSRDPAFVLFSIIGHIVFQIANVLIKFLKIKVHQIEFYSEIPLKIVLGKWIIQCEKTLWFFKTRNFLTTKSTFESCEILVIKIFKTIIISIPIKTVFTFIRAFIVFQSNYFKKFSLVHFTCLFKTFKVYQLFIG